MKTIKYTILFLTFIVALYYSQSVTLLAPIIWDFLYGNHELYSLYFICITSIYLIFIYSYFNLLNINRQLTKFLFNKLSFYNLFLLILNIIYDIYHYLFQFIQPILIFYITKVSKSKILFIYLTKYYHLKLEYFLFILSRAIPFFKYGFSSLLYGTDLLKNSFLNNQSEREFIASLIKKAYIYPIYIKCNGRTEKLSEKLSKILREDRESTTKFQNKILTETGKIRTKIKEHIEDYDSKFVDKFLEKPIENQTEIPRLTNINEISKTLAVLYSNVSNQNFIQNVSFYTSTKSSLKLGDSFTA